MDKKTEIEHILLGLLSLIGMDKPINFDQIVEFCFQDIDETADKENWNESDVTIAFRRWIEAQTKDEFVDEALSQTVNYITAWGKKVPSQAIWNEMLSKVKTIKRLLKV